MDPNTLLDQIRTTAVAMAHEEENLTGAEVVEFADRFLALDEWIRKGGFLPRPWQPQDNDAPGSSVELGARNPGEPFGRVAQDVDTDLMDRAAGFPPEDEGTGYPAPGAGPIDPDLPLDPDDDPKGPPYFGDNLRPSRRRPPGDK